MKKFFSFILSLTMMFTLVVTASASTFAEEPAPNVVLNADNTVTFSNLDKIAADESVEFDVIDAEGNPATIGLTRIPSMTRASSTTWKVSYTGVVINCSFYMTVTDNKVTSVYDYWILTIGATYDNESLTKTTSTGTLTFKVSAYAGVMAGTCWLKGTTTGKSNDITISYQM